MKTTQLLDENHVILKIWDAKIKKWTWVQVKYRFDDPWLNLQEWVSATEEERELFQLKPITPKIVNQIIQEATEELELPSEDRACSNFVITKNGTLEQIETI